MSLFEIQSQWITKYDEMRVAHGLDGQLLAGPFLSVPDPFEQTSKLQPILLVGQATREDWFLSRFKTNRGKPIHKRVEERLNTTREFLMDPKYNQYKKTDFWRFWKNLKERTGAPVIWTNLAKIGVKTGKIPYKFQSEQKDLALKTLEAEIEQYKPALVVFVTGPFLRLEIIRPFFGMDEDCFNKETKCCSRKQISNSPALLWTFHPRSIRKEMICAWLDKANALYKAAL